jgi:hypothetical protein
MQRLYQVELQSNEQLSLQTQRFVEKKQRENYLLRQAME